MRQVCDVTCPLLGVLARPFVLRRAEPEVDQQTSPTCRPVRVVAHSEMAVSLKGRTGPAATQVQQAMLRRRSGRPPPGRRPAELRVVDTAPFGTPPLRGDSTVLEL